MFLYTPPARKPFDTTWTFVSPSGSFGTFYVGGFYVLGSTNYIPAGGTALGTANSAYGAHAFIVLGATSTNMVVTVTGTSIDEQGNRAASDTEDIDTSGGVADTYYETEKKWIGQISLSLKSGTGININDGLCKYWDNQNTNFKLTGIEVSGLAGANDTGPDFRLIHHKSAGWTYNAGASPTPPTPIYGMQTDYNTEFQLVNGEPFAWKRTELTNIILGGSSEGLICEAVTTANRAVEILSWKNSIFTV